VGKARAAVEGGGAADIQIRVSHYAKSVGAMGSGNTRGRTKELGFHRWRTARAAIR
jgi:hypothetical protein